MGTHPTEEELLDGLDSDAPELQQHLALCEACRIRAAEFRAGIEAVARASAPTSPPLPDRIGPYAIQCRLGEGGMGIVYEGEQQTTQRRVAVKVVRGGPYVDETRLKLFQREVRTLARLKHPAIASIFEAGRTNDGQHFLAMELVRGSRLDEFVRAGAVPRRKRLELFCDICDAIHYAHQRGVIHRDLKPTNILVDSEGRAKILDFSLARIMDSDGELSISRTEFGKVMGTLPYMSPEVARGNPDAIDVRSDVYSLGVILYELMTDRYPYALNKAVLHESVRAICEEAPRRPSTLDRGLRGDLETIMMKALEKERGRRYQSAAALAEDITRFLVDQPILARRASVLYQIRKFAQRHMAFVAVTVVFLGVISGAALWVHVLERQHRIDTQRTTNLLDLADAVMQLTFAETQRVNGQYVKAERHYRDAITTFFRLGRFEPERAGRAMLGLGLLLTARAQPTVEDYEEAEGLLNDAVAIFEAGGPRFYAEQRQALQALLVVYGPDVGIWDDPEVISEIKAKLGALPTPSDESP